MNTPTRHSLIAGVTESLREAIKSGEFGDHLPGVRHLGRELCVSVPTILEAVKVLEGEGVVAVKQGCRTQVLFSNKRSAKELAGRKTAVLLAYPTVQLDESYTRDVVDRLRKQGYEVIPHQMKDWNFSLSGLKRLVALHPAAHWVLLGSPVATQEFFSVHKLPCLVACGSAGDGVHLPDFEMDFSALYRHVANQFLNSGHRRFHLIIGEQSAQKNPKCLEAFVEAVRQRDPGRKMEDLILTYDNSTGELKALLEGLFGQAEKPTALCVALVSRYIFTQGWLQTNGFRIPEDVSLICRDGDDLMDCIFPSPSHYAYRSEIYGRRLARAIATLLETGRVKDHTLLIPEFVKGDSMGPVSEPAKKHDTAKMLQRADSISSRVQTDQKTLTVGVD